MKSFFARELAFEFLVQPGHADFQHPVKLLFFRADDFGDAGGGVFEFWVGADHQVTDGVDHLVEEWLLLAK